MPVSEPSATTIQATILDLLSRRAPTASICPSDVARALGDSEAQWRALMPLVREVAAGMARAGRLRITRGATLLAPDELGRGPIRLRRP